jgi:hypothetical protein
MLNSDLENLIEKLPPELQECIDREALPNLSAEEKEYFVKNVEYLLAAEKTSNKSASIQLKHNPVPDAAVGFGALVGFYLPVHEGLHAIITNATGGKVHGIEANNYGVAVISSGPMASELASATVPYFILTPLGLYYIKEGVKEKDSAKVMFGSVSLSGTLTELIPYESVNIQSDLLQAATIISNYIHSVPDGTIKAGLIAGIFAFSYGVVKAADWAKSKFKNIENH